MNDLNMSSMDLQVSLDNQNSSIEEVNLHDVAIVGVSLRFPYANSLKEFENNLSHGIECIKPFPEKRKKFADNYLKLKNIKESYLKYHKGGYIDDVDSFDHDFFGIPPKEASLMDPNQRMFLQVAWEAIEDGGYGGKKLSNTRTGVYMGFTPNTEIFDYRQIVTDLEYDMISMAIPGNLNSIMPSRIAYHLDLKGPTLLVDTACSSSLVAVHLACRGLQNGDCDYAIAGGVRLTLFPLEQFARIGIESSDGKTRSFDAKADGTGVGEGVAAILLKPLYKAIADNDDVYAVIKGSAINQDGASAGITAPNGKAQEDVMIKAWEDANINPLTLSYIEAHGTATKIGDPIEVNSISNAMANYTNKKQFCGIGSVKSNIGHLHASAGIAGLIKCVLSLRNQKLYPSINYETPNAHINLEQSAIYVNDKITDWQIDKNPRRCGINSFGFSGTNCHIVLEEATTKPTETSINEVKPEIFTISARNASSFNTLLDKYINYVTQNFNNKNVTLQDICYTANTGRGHYEHRAAFVVSSKDELLEKLEELADSTKQNIAIVDLKDSSAIEEISLKAESTTIALCDNELDRDKLTAKICDYYLRGANIIWDKIYLSSNSCQRKHLPVYSFNQVNCSIELPLNMPENDMFNYETIVEKKQAPKIQQVDITLTGNTDNNYTEYQKQVAQVWGNVLGYKTLDVNQNFFHLGGESITLMQIVQRLAEQFNVNLSMKDFVQDATISGLAKHISENIGKETRFIYPQQESDLANIYNPFPLTEIQAAYLVGRDSNFELGGIGTHIYSEIESELDITQLNDALNKVIARHPMLRATFSKETQQQQILQTVPTYRIAQKDISNLTKDLQQEEIEKERERMSHHVFEPSTWPLFEMTAYKIDSEKNYLFFGYDMLIADGLSIQIFENELINYYNNPSLVLPNLDFSFRDYMLAYEGFKQSQQYNLDKEFHIQNIEEIPFGPSLVTRVPLSKIATPKFNRKRETFAKEEWIKLKAIAREMKVTPSALILTLYAKVLNFWCSEERFTINLTVFNRYPFNKEINKLIGDFTSVILMKMDFSVEKNLEQLIEDTNIQMMEALSHRHFDGVSVIRELSRRNNTGTKALMPVVFTSMLIDEKTSDFDLTQRLGTFTYGVSQTSQVYLDNQLTEENGALHITWDYEENVFDTDVIDTMFDQYIGAVKSILAGSKNINVEINTKEKEFILEYNKSEKEFDIQTLDSLFNKALLSNSTKNAIVSDDEVLTFAQLDEKSNKIANYLVSQNISNNSCVVVVAHRTPSTIANMLGILKAGGTYVPIEPDYPQDRKEYVISNSNASIILDQNSYQEHAIDSYDATPINGRSNAEALAYIIYTSGSTGKPKGVMITHKAAANTILDINDRFGITSSDNIIGLSSMCFDLSVYDIFGALSTGATLYMVPDLKNTDYISDMIAEHQITFWNSVPSVMNLMVENLSINENKKYVKYNSLRNVLLSGDWIPVDLPQRIKNYFPSSNVISLGGATEASIWSIYYPINDVNPSWKSIPYGYPLANQKFFVLDKELNYCPLGVEGELFIGGDGVASGYLNDIEKTKNAFIQHKTLGYIYRTGDYGILHKEGYIEFMGRKDAQVKIRGHRIELGEIESNLLQHHGVSQAIAMVVELEPGDKKIVSYVTPSYRTNWDYDITGNLLESKQKTMRLPFNEAVELSISGKTFQTKGVDLSTKALTIDGNYDADELISVTFKIPNTTLPVSIKGEVIIITQNKSVILFNDSQTVINDLQVKLDEYYQTISLDSLEQQKKELDLLLNETVKVKFKTGEILEQRIRMITPEGITCSLGTTNLENFNNEVEVEFTIDGLQGALTLAGTIEWNNENAFGIKFSSNDLTTRTLISLIINYSELSGISSQVLKEHLKNRVPDYMLPYTFIIIDSIPLTSNQKVDRKRLPKPTIVKDEVSIDAIEPRNSIERKIHEMWCEILKRDSISVYDNFFELGGDSLQVYQIAMKAEAEYKIKIPIDSLYKDPTIANISSFIKDVLEKSGCPIPEEMIETSVASGNSTLHWLPGAIWNLQDGKVVINESVYDAADLFPKLYFLTQNGCDIDTIHQEFIGKDISKINKVIEWLTNDGILVSSLTTWHKVFAPQKKLFKNKYDLDLLFNKEKHRKFKEEQMTRQFEGDRSLKIELLSQQGALPKTITERRSYRNFNEKEIISFEDLSLLLSVFKQEKNNNGEYQYYYASSGALYPIDIYLYVKENRVDMADRGLYYYHPATHKLNLISDKAITDSSAYVKNKEIFKSSAITMYMVFNAESSMPVYGSDGYFYACLDAGIMISSLTQVAETRNIGLCSIGDMNFDVIKEQFKLKEHQVFLHAIELGIKPTTALSNSEVLEAYERNYSNKE